ncbi:hypothetical protein J2X31_002106 [Flavobacterium arsenatis]|uniref:Uncharacterized protein n=1 Tax=Flavobacterium arsenatis TaxID=1484332 RepID=A0ABU1TQ62_9FLAO|nr:hypothetical protein [Flavobacterium arsenatis]
MKDFDYTIYDRGHFALEEDGEKISVFMAKGSKRND